MNKKLEDIANQVIDKLPAQDPEKFGFVITVLMIISITLTLIRVLQECNKTKVMGFSQPEKYEYFGSQIKEKTIRRSFFTRMMVKKAIRKELPKELYKEYGVALMNAMLDTGENLTQDQIKTLVEAANV